VRRRAALLAVTTLAAGIGVPAAMAGRGDGPAPAIYLVGGAVESINPTQAMLANDDFFLGGYGFGSGRVANQVVVPSATDALGNRYATGILGRGHYDAAGNYVEANDGDGAHSRAFVVSDGKSTIVLSQIETQGYFNAYKQGPFGENEIRKDAAAQIATLYAAAKAADATLPPGLRKHQNLAPAPTASQIVVDSDHSHGGPDTAGVWGGVPTSYLKMVHDQTVKAIVDAWQNTKRATLTYGIAHAGVNGEAQYPPQECLSAGKPDCQGVSNADWILNNQFSGDTGQEAGVAIPGGGNQDMDDEIRVLQARDPDTGEVLDTYSNYSSHPTVLGSDNTKVTGDYVGRLDMQMEQAFGGFAMDQVATLGREQPARQDCPGFTGGDANPDEALCKLDSYAARVLTKVKEALADAHPMTGAPVVAMNSYLLTDPTTSGVLAGVSYAGDVIGVPAGRAANAPWYTGNLLGTSLFVGRIGSILITGGPGEMYAQIWQKVKDTVTADPTSGITSDMNIGTAGDFLGYIIAPLEAYPEPAYSSVASHDTSCNGVPDPAGVCPDPVGNDNYFFNISHTFGERLTCDFLRGAGDILANDAQKYWSTYNRCAAFVNDLALPPGQDTQFPEQPDLSSVLTHM
jgi:hypothetical protein